MHPGPGSLRERAADTDERRRRRISSFLFYTSICPNKLVSTPAPVPHVPRPSPRHLRSRKADACPAVCTRLHEFLRTPRCAVYERANLLLSAHVERSRLVARLPVERSSGRSREAYEGVQNSDMYTRKRTLLLYVSSSDFSSARAWTCSAYEPS